MAAITYDTVATAVRDGARTVSDIANALGVDPSNDRLKSTITNAADDGVLVEHWSDDPTPARTFTLPR